MKVLKISLLVVIVLLTIIVIAVGIDMWRNELGNALKSMTGLARSN